MTVSRIHSTKSPINSIYFECLCSRPFQNVFLVPLKMSWVSFSLFPFPLSLSFFFSLFSLFFSFFPRPLRTLFSFFSLFLFLILDLSLKSSLLEFFLVNKGFLPCFPVFFWIEKEKKETTHSCWQNSTTDAETATGTKSLWLSNLRLYSLFSFLAFQNGKEKKDNLRGKGTLIQTRFSGFYLYYILLFIFSKLPHIVIISIVFFRFTLY